MLDLHFFGTLRRYSKNSKATDDSILMVEYIKRETVRMLLNRLEINEEVGDIFINRIIADENVIINMHKEIAGSCPDMKGFFE